MANYSNLLAQIEANIYSNNTQKITGDILQLQLNAMVASLGSGYQFMGVAHPADSPTSYADLRCFWVAGESGTYVNFGGIVVNVGEVVILKYDTSWHKVVTGAATAAQLSELINEVSANTDNIENLQQEIDAIQPIVIEGNVTNAPDEEDITTDENDLLKFANRPTAVNQMGYKILRKDKTFAEQVTDANTIYEIRYNFNLGGALVTIPAGSVLKFVGGQLSNGILGGSFSINDTHTHIFNDVDFNENIQLNVDHIRPEWYGAKGDRQTDDSASITEAIRQANLSGVNKVQFSACEYFINSGISVTSGDIILEGVYNTVREDLKFSSPINDVKYRKKSTLVAGPLCTSILTFTESVTHPAIIRHLGFYNYDVYLENRSAFDCVGIRFSSAFNGPTWPFVVEYCHFHGLYYGILFKNDSLNYLISNVRISGCSFDYNFWCVFFDDNVRNYDGSESIKNYTWNFLFENNCCHDNTFQLYVTTSVDNCIVRNNNLEGDLLKMPNSTVENPVEIPMEFSSFACSVIKLRSYAKLQFKDNHFEQNNKKVLQVVDANGEATIDITGNFFNLESTPRVLELLTLNNITNLDFAPSFHIKNIEGFTEIIIKHPCSINVGNLDKRYKVASGALVCLRFDVIENAEAITAAKWGIQQAGTSFTYVNGKKYATEKSNQTYIINPYTLADQEDNNYIVICAEAYHTKPLATSMQIAILGISGSLTNVFPGERKFVMLVYNALKTDTRQYSFYNNYFSDCFVHSIAAEVVKSATEIPANALAQNLVSPHNLAASSELVNISNARIGDEIWVTDTKKKEVFDGASWVSLN